MKRVFSFFLAAAVMLTLSACGGSADRAVSESESPSVKAESPAASETGLMYRFYSNIGENLKNGDVDGFDGHFTDTAMAFLAEHDALFEKNEPLSDEDSSKLADTFDLRDVEKNPDLHTSQLFYGTGIITDIQEEMLDDNTCATQGIILYDGQSNTAEYCYFMCSGSVPLYTGDEVEFVALPLGVGNVDLTDNTKQRCVYIACTYLQGLNEAADSSSLLPDDTGGTAVDQNSFDDGSDEGLDPISEEDRMPGYVYIAVWPGWAERDPAYPEYKDITYGEVLDYLFDGNDADWSYDKASDSVKVSGTYTTFNYTMGMADEPTLCNVQLTFTVGDSGWDVSGFRGDECDSGEYFMELAYSYYYQGNCY